MLRKVRRETLKYGMMIDGRLLHYTRAHQTFQASDCQLYSTLEAIGAVKVNGRQNSNSQFRVCLSTNRTCMALCKQPPPPPHSGYWRLLDPDFSAAVFDSLLDVGTALTSRMLRDPSPRAGSYRRSPPTALTTIAVCLQ